MTKQIGYYNGRMGAPEELMIPMQDRAMFFGDGVYDYAFAYNKIMFAADDHINRFFRSMEMMEITPYCSKEELKAELQKCVDAADSDEGLAVYWQTSRGNCKRNHIFPPEGTPSTLLITVSPLKKMDYSVPLRLITVEDTRFFHCNIKTLNLIPNVMAAQRAEEAGCGEAVFHRGEYMTECAHSAAVILKDGKVIAPPLDELILPSISRIHVFDICRELGIPTEERKVTMKELSEADEIFILSTSKLMTRANEIDGKPAGMKDTALFEKIQNAYFKRVEAETGYWMGN